MHDKVAATSKRPFFSKFFLRILKENQHCFTGCPLPVDGVTCKFSQGKFNGRTPDARENYLAFEEHEAPARRVSSWETTFAQACTPRPTTTPAISVKLISHLDQLLVWKKEKMTWYAITRRVQAKLAKLHRANSIYWVYFWKKCITKQMPVISVIFKQMFLHYFLLSQASMKVFDILSIPLTTVP